MVIKVVYPYSLARYDMVYRLFKQARFQLVNPRVEGSKPLELFVAPTLIELSHVTGVSLTKATPAIEDDEGDETEAKAFDLSGPEILKAIE